MKVRGQSGVERVERWSKSAGMGGSRASVVNQSSAAPDWLTIASSTTILTWAKIVASSKKVEQALVGDQKLPVDHNSERGILTYLSRSARYLPGDVVILLVVLRIFEQSNPRALDL